MNKEIDLSKYQIRTDLTIEHIEDKVKLKYEKRIEKLKETIMEQEEKIVQLYQELVDRKIQNDILERELEKIKEEKLKIEARTKTERE